VSEEEILPYLDLDGPSNAVLFAVTSFPLMFAHQYA